MAGIVMVAGIAFGASSGFLAGSLAAFVSNFIFGQGPWTPWQMLAFGLGGCLFGFLADRGVIPRGSWSMKTRILVGLGGGLYILLVGGPILDTSSLVWMVSSLTPESALAVYAAGAPFNAVHGLATFATIALAGNAILDKLARLRTKYGMMGDSERPPTPLYTLRLKSCLAKRPSYDASSSSFAITASLPSISSPSM